MKTEKIQPWERQPGESQKAFEAFSSYRDLGAERSLRAVREQLGKSKALIERWSSKYKWVDRAAAYDNELEKQVFKKRKKQIADTKDKHLKIATLLEKKALSALEKVKPDQLTVKEIKEILKLAIDIEQKTLLNEEVAVTEDNTSSVSDAIIAAYQRRMEEGDGE